MVPSLRAAVVVVVVAVQRCDQPLFNEAGFFKGDTRFKLGNVSSSVRTVQTQQARIFKKTSVLSF